MINMADALALAKKNSDMLNALIQQTTKLANAQQIANRVQQEYTKGVKEDTEAEEQNFDALDRRTKAINRAIETMEGMGKQFELLNYQSLQAFRAEQGNIFEYLDMLLTSTKEQVKILGIEAGTARRVLYGFFPPGMFSLVSKLSTGMKFAGAVTRKFTTTTDEAGKKQKNLFTLIGSGLGVLTKFRKKTEEITEAQAAAEMGETTKKAKNTKRGMFGNKRNQPVAHRRKASGDTEDFTEDFLSTVLSASPEALYKNMELAEKASKELKLKEAADAKKAAKKKMDIQKHEITATKSRLKVARRFEEKELKEVNKIKKELSKEAYDKSVRRIEQQMKKQIEAEYKKKKLTDEQIKLMEYETNLEIQRRTEAYRIGENTRDIFKQMRELDFKDLAENSTALSHAADKLEQASKLTSERKGQVDAAKKEFDNLKSIRDTAVNDSKILKQTAKRRKKADKKQQKVMEKQKKIAEKQYKWAQIRAKIEDIRENKLGPLKEGLKMFMFGVMKAILIIVAALIVLQALWPSIKNIIGTVISVMMFGIGLVMEGVLQIFAGLYGVYEALMSGDLMDLLMALADVVIGFGKVFFGLLVAIFGTLLTFVGALVVDLLGRAKNWFMSLGKDIKSVGKIVGLILAVAGMIVAAIMGAPILLIAGIGILLYKVGKYIVSKIPGFSNGGVSTGGLAVVGEKGPELVNLPRGSRVHSNSQSKRMVSSSGTTNNFNITINARDTSDSELRRIADKIGQMVNSKINRTTSSATMR